MKHFGLKILSLVVAFLLYAYVHSQSNSSVVALVVPVEIKNLPENKMILLPRTRQAQVTIKGPSFLVRDLAISALTFRVNMPADVSNQYTIRLNEKSLSVPSTVRVLSIEPSEIELILDDVIETELPIVVPRIGKLQEAYSLVSRESIPSRTLVRGPKTEVQSLKRVESDPVDFRELVKSQSFKLKLRSPGKYTQAAQKVVRHTINIKALTTEKRFKKVPVKLLGSASKEFEASPKHVQVEVSGPVLSIQNLKLEELQASTKVNSKLVDGTSAKVVVTVPKDIELVIVDPESISLVKKGK